MSDNEKSGLAGVAIIVALIVGLLSWVWGVSVGWDLCKESTQQQAVVEGRGKWVPDTDGKPKFEWVYPEKAKP